MKPIHLGPAQMIHALGENNKGMEFALLHVLMKHDNYLEYYKEINKNIILDNSMYELGKPLNYDDLERHALYLSKPKRIVYVVLPDYLHDCRHTIESFTEYTSKIHFAMFEKYCRPLPVIQAKNQAELQASKHFYIKELRRYWPDEKPLLAIPKLSVFREDIVYGKTLWDKDYSLHMFGCNSFDEWVEMNKNPQIISSDGFLVARTVLGKERFGKNWGEKKFFYNPTETELENIRFGCFHMTRLLETFSK